MHGALTAIGTELARSWYAAVRSWYAGDALTSPILVTGKTSVCGEAGLDCEDC